MKKWNSLVLVVFFVSCSNFLIPKFVAVEGISFKDEMITLNVGQSQKIPYTVTPSGATEQGVSWLSRNTQIVTVKEDGTVTALAEGHTTLVVTTKDGHYTDKCKVTVKKGFVPVATLALDDETLSLEVNQSTPLGFVISPPNATNKAVTWQTSDDEIAQISETGLLTALKEGNVQITVTTEDGAFTDQCSITIVKASIPVQSIDIIEDNVVLDAEEFGQLTYAITPANATNQNVTWTLSDPNLAELSDTGLFIGKTAGSVVITITTEDGGFTDTCNITFQEVLSPVENIVLDPDTLTLKEGETTLLTARVYPSDASNQKIRWSSSDTNVAQVSDTGIVTAKTVGTAEITVTTDDGGFTDTCSLTVQSSVVSVNGILLDQSTLKLQTGLKGQLAATISPLNAANPNFSWSSSDASIATVSDDGEVLALAAGEATITATTEDGSFTDTCTVTCTKMFEAPDWALGVWKSEAGNKVEITDETLIITANGTIVNLVEMALENNAELTHNVVEFMKMWTIMMGDNPFPSFVGIFQPDGTTLNIGEEAFIKDSSL
ncbi:MAG: Ig-like domain-containing protein [Spirochaetales bacterium]|nr:Ig-like domain-containing protein [Spirochaetales bacterium]